MPMKNSPHRRLKKMAAESGRSMEAEHREILNRVVLGSRTKTSLKKWLMEIPEVGQDRDFARQGGRPRKVRL